jgi:predicted Ser/Thr protein kinase
MNPSQNCRKTIMTYSKVKSGKGFLIKKIKKQMEKRRDVSLHNTNKQARDF